MTFEGLDKEVRLVVVVADFLVILLVDVES